METNLENQFANDITAPPARPQFLKIICILSFVSCGLWILIYLFGTFLLGVSEENANEVLEKMRASNAMIDTDNPYEAVKAFGMVCLLGLICNIVSLVGVIMMWNLNKIGFFVYILGEFVIYFFGNDMKASTESGKSYGMMAFTIILDLAFIIMYAVNLKHMKGKSQEVIS